MEFTPDMVTTRRTCSSERCTSRVERQWRLVPGGGHATTGLHTDSFGWLLGARRPRRHAVQDRRGLPEARRPSVVSKRRVRAVGARTPGLLLRHADDARPVSERLLDGELSGLRQL